MGSMRTRCPQCRATSVPSLLSLDQLPENEFANKLADLVREQDGNLTSGLDSEELYVGELLEPQSKPKKLTRKESCTCNA
ncbi:hypothetical protein EB796_000267 [Bugula neritina]|uniref:Uncharacterized protein n=1 Tax=Bugula neritina TaxID=10212 RepID=A0A7J7KT82_BUGNE|nr:hypothetical protein EB796_000267 [Bugula neritina]